MGIYESKMETLSPDRTVLHIVRDPGYGKIIVETWIKICEIHDRKACYCCSCGDREGSDAYCRNHGFAGTRPCEEHEMPGVMVHPEDWDEEGPPHMPESVQKTRARWESSKSETKEGSNG